MNFKNFLLEGADEAAEIRQLLKTALKLSNRDVSVKSSYGGLSSSVTVAIKTLKALYLMRKIEYIAKDEEDYTTDDQGEIMGGGNTFIFTSIDDKLKSKLTDMVKEEYVKQSNGSLELMESCTLYKKFVVTRHEHDYTMLVKGARSVINFQSDEYIGSDLLRLIARTEDDDLYKLIK